ncbi:hypothetical protein Y032_0045g1268 [Ancylostoma ceylanicum]|uniref:Uncharacterized protein n=1 Tax=Ancylostoma ceylanicum TaxID=53326 RepID=A0A016UE32_9BILA|nr:hypothetical protein Y032_0045g1268 [Ancylostoma ceylanicum]
MCSLSEEEKVFRVLRELRERAESADVREDVEKLEKLLNDPLFKQYSRKSATKDTGKDTKRDSNSPLVTFLRENVENDLLEQLKDNQKLHFVEFDVRALQPEVLDPRRDDRFLLIAGPKDVKARSAGQLRIGDRIAAIARWHAHSGGDATATANDAASPPVGVAATRVGGAATATAAATPTPPHLLIRSPTAAEFRDAANAARSATLAIAIAIIRETTSMVVMSADGGDPSAASKGTRRYRAARSALRDIKLWGFLDSQMRASCWLVWAFAANAPGQIAEDPVTVPRVTCSEYHRLTGIFTCNQAL